MNAKLRLEYRVHFGEGRRGRKVMNHGEATAGPPLKVPRVARIMALAIHLHGLVRDGKVANFASLARLGHVGRSRVSQIMVLLQLAPDIQEEILFLPPKEGGRDAIRERDVRAIARVPDWRKQRTLWKNGLGTLIGCHHPHFD